MKQGTLGVVAVNGHTGPVTLDLLDALMQLRTSSTACNFYQPESDAAGDFSTTADERLERLREHLRRTESGDLVFVGEAAGWNGARQSGVPFTSAADVGLRGSTEPSSIAMHRLLARYGLANRALLWNAFPLHPHKVSDPCSNRTPTAAEFGSGQDAVRVAVRGRRIVCVGRKAQLWVHRATGFAIPDASQARETDHALSIRHPSHGGGPEFLAQGSAALELWGLRAA